jgi:CubicO group peptidase (beta-lactamase class C family)
MTFRIASQGGRPLRTTLALTLKLAAMLLLPQSPIYPQAGPLGGFDAYVERVLRDWRVPGLAIVVVKGDSVVFMKGYGTREVGKNEPVTVHTRFGNMSTTKAFTALLVAMAVDSGQVRWDDPVVKYVPNFQLHDPYVTRELVVRDLLTHRVGFPDPDYLWAFTSLPFDEMVNRLQFVQPVSSLRSRFAYNNVTYALAGDIAVHAAGKTWQVLLHQRILDPLGMNESYATGEELLASGVKDITSPHAIVHDTVRLLPVPVTLIDPVAPAGAMFSTATDMAEWLRFLLDGGRVSGRRLVSAQNFGELFRPQQVLAGEFYPTARLTRPHFQVYGMGWFLGDYRGEFVAFPTGSIEGRSAIVGLMPDCRIGVAILTNLDHSELRHALMYTVFDRYLPRDKVSHDWSTEMLTLYRALEDTAAAQRRKQEAKRVMNTHPSLPIDSYVGTYSDSLFGTATVRLDRNRLTLQVGTHTADLEHWQYDIFRVNWRDPFWASDYASFTLDSDGTVSEVRFVGDPRRYRRSASATQPR